MTIATLIREINADELNVDSVIVTPGARFVRDLGADSLDVVELTMRLGEQFGIEISDEDAENLLTVGDVVRYIQFVAPPGAGRRLRAAGGVYMLKCDFSGTTYYKIGRALDFARRIRQVKLQLPVPAKEVHRIHAHDGNVAENYWHRKFALKRLNGEWFALTKKDVAEFKRHDHM